MSPPAIILTAERNRFGGLHVIDMVVQQHTHGRRASAEDDELHSVLMQYGAVRQHVRELEFGMNVSHEHGAASCGTQVGCDATFIVMFCPIKKSQFPNGQAIHHPQLGVNAQGLLMWGPWSLANPLDKRARENVASSWCQ
ncbi:MAG: hypothetical protein U0894_05510 [Pirellulales bacterium]